MIIPLKTFFFFFYDTEEEEEEEEEKTEVAIRVDVPGGHKTSLTKVTSSRRPLD